MKWTITILSVLLLFSCSEERKKSVIEEMNEAKCDDALGGVRIDDRLGMDDGRNIVFIFDESCSYCNAQYVMLCKSLANQECRYDSIITIVNGSNDMMIADYNLKKMELKRPEREHVVYDKELDISNYLYSLSDNNPLMLFENRTLIYKSHTTTKEND